MILTVRLQKSRKTQRMHFDKVSIMLLPGKRERKSVRVPAESAGFGQKRDPFTFAQEKADEVDSESEEDLEPWDQPEAEGPLRRREAGPDPLGPASELMGVS